MQSALRFLAFTAVAFGPLLLIGGLLWAGVLLNLLLIPLGAPPRPDALTIALLLALAVGIPAGLLALPAAAFAVSRAVQAWPLRALAIYLAWLPLAGLLILILNGALAGASMAVVDGVVSGGGLLRSVAEETVKNLLAWHLVIVPWALLAAWFARRLGLLPPGNSSAPEPSR